MSKNITYRDSGVDIDKANVVKDDISNIVRNTYNERVISEPGLFGGFYDIANLGYEHPVLVSSTDGVGTKLKVAIQSGRHDTIGQDLVNHCVNDILTSGASPLFFLDYVALGKLDEHIVHDIVSGLAVGCKQNGLALVGGETAQMPEFYRKGDYDLAGTIVGVVEKSRMIDGRATRKGDVLIGLPSNGLHTNGYSLARTVLLSKYKLDDHVPELSSSLADELLKIHKSYYYDIKDLLKTSQVHGISHITGGGIVENTERILAPDLILNVDWAAWNLPPVFNLIQEMGGIPDEEMRRTFNLGIGLILVVDKSDVDVVVAALEEKSQKPIVLGEIG